MRRSGKFLVHLLSQSRSRSVCALLVLFLVCHTAPLSAPTIRGFFLLFDSQLNFVDGTDLIFNTARQLFFPNVSPSTILSFVHTGIGELSVSVALYANDGHLVRRQDLNMAPLSGFSGSLDALVPCIAGFGGYVVGGLHSPFVS